MITSCRKKLTFWRNFGGFLEGFEKVGFCQRLLFMGKLRFEEEEGGKGVRRER